MTLLFGSRLAFLLGCVLAGSLAWQWKLQMSARSLAPLALSPVSSRKALPGLGPCPSLKLQRLWLSQTAC